MVPLCRSFLSVFLIGFSRLQGRDAPAFLRDRQ
jgi:hypothetical protein